MAETIELCTAGQVVTLPTGISVSMPYLPWTPEVVAAMTEEDRAEALRFIRKLRESALGR